MAAKHGMSASSSGRLLAAPGKSSRFQVKKLYDRLFEEVTSHMDSGNTQVAVKLINSRTSEVNNADENGFTLLMSACKRGDQDITQALLKAGASVDCCDNDSWTPLMYACRDGHAEIARELLDAGANMEKRDVGGWTALMWACYKGRTECAEILVKNNANVNIKAMYNMTCLHWAAGRGHSDIVALLIKHGAKIDATDKYGSTPLIWAARKGFHSIVLLLLEAGASSDACGMYSWTPLLVALQGGHLEVAQEILKMTPNTNTTDKSGMTALALAAKAGFIDVVDDLLDQGAYLNVVDKNGDTVLHHAVKGGHYEVVKLLFKKNPDIDAKGNENKTVLYLAVEKGNVQIMKLILSQDPDKELVDKEGNTPLLRAVKNRNYEMTFLLLEKGARVAAADQKGDTALHVAMRARNRKMLELLLKAPRNARFLYVRNKAGETPYTLDGGHRKSLLAHIFGARSLNSQDAVESQLGYELYSSALADILSSPTLNTPMTVGLFAKWGSGKSFMLTKLKEDMTAYMKQSPKVYFEFSILVFVVNVMIATVLGLLLSLAGWVAGLVTGIITFIVLYGLEGTLVILDRKNMWDWVTSVSHFLAKRIQRLRLMSYMLLFNKPQPLSEEATTHSICFVFAESAKLTSLGGDHSLASMIGSLCDNLEKKYGALVTRLYRVFGSKKVRHVRFKRICCIPSFFVILAVLVCGVTALVMLRAYHDVGHNSMHINIAMLVLACICGLALLLSVPTIGKTIAAYYNSPKRRTQKAASSLNMGRGDNFISTLREEVHLISSMVETMDIHEQWQTRLVLIVDGLDSCEQDKVLQVLDTINLVIPENSPFVVLLALDPHIIIKGIEANQLKGVHDSSLNGYGYLMNLVHLPFYLQNHGLPRMHTTSEQTQLKKWHNAVKEGLKQKTQERQPSVFSSNLSLEGTNKNKGRRYSVTADSMTAVEPLHHYIGEMPKNIMKNDYFVDVNPRSLRRLMNIIALAGRLLRANDVEFDWYRLSSWINITEQWPYRTSWILLYYEEMEGRLDDTMSLLTIYNIIKERIPASRDLEPLLDIDRNEKKFIAFLKSHVPKLNVDDLKKFMAATINLDPFLRKIIKEKSKDQEMMLHERIRPSPAETVKSPTTMYPMSSSISRYQQYPVVTPTQRIMMPQFPAAYQLPNPRAIYQQTAAIRGKIPAGVKSLSRSSVSDICELLPKIKGLTTSNLPKYQQVIESNNINGIVLSECDMDELKPIVMMSFGDWQIFKSTILAMRESDVYQENSNSSANGILSESSSYHSMKAKDADGLISEKDEEEDSDDEDRDTSMPPSLASSMPGTPALQRSISMQSRNSNKAATMKLNDATKGTVFVESQMILKAVHTLIPDADSPDSQDEDDDYDENQDTVVVVNKNSTTSAADVVSLRSQTFEDNSSIKNVTFALVNETSGGSQGNGSAVTEKDTQPLIGEEEDAFEMEEISTSRKSKTELQDAKSLRLSLPKLALPVITEAETNLHSHSTSSMHGLVNPGFTFGDDNTPTSA